MEQTIETLKALSRGGFGLPEVYVVIILIFALYIAFFISRPLLERKFYRLINKILPARSARREAFLEETN